MGGIGRPSALLKSTFIKHCRYNKLMLNFQGEKDMILYRPVGTAELDLIAQSGYKSFPPRLPEQPIFYPVLNKKYAQEIAEKWNTKDTSDHKGYVTQFEVDDEYCSQFTVHTVGKNYHKELWIPAEELETFNQHIIGEIKVISVFSD